MPGHKPANDLEMNEGRRAQEEVEVEEVKEEEEEEEEEEEKKHDDSKEYQVRVWIWSEEESVVTYGNCELDKTPIRNGSSCSTSGAGREEEENGRRTFFPTSNSVLRVR